jgi:alpha-L-rhamnosidase
MKFLFPVSRALIALPVCLPLVCHAQDVRVTDLRCEYVTNPLGVDTLKPCLSWRLESDTPGQVQTAYQILAAGSPDKLKEGSADLWDSGKVGSGQSQLIPYAGSPLSWGSRCHWAVRTWDRNGKVSDWSEPGCWTMALDEQDWIAQWISAPDSSVPPESGNDLKITRATYRTLDGKVEKDVTETVRKLIEKGRSLRVDFKVLGGDPARGRKKELVVEFVKDGKTDTARAPDFKTLDLSGKKEVRSIPTPQFRKDFELDALPSSAYVTVHSPAYFELHVNGEKVGKDVLSPAVSDHGKETFSLTYDVLPFLKAGENCMGLWLGPGWAESMVARAQLVAMVDGKSLVIGTDPSWKTRPSGRYRIGQNKWGDFGGEFIDGAEVLPSWCQPGSTAGSWGRAVVSRPALGPVRRQPCPPNRLGEPVSPVSVTDIGEGLYEIDFGRALTGWFRMKMPGLEKGTRVTLIFADTKTDQEEKKRTKMGDQYWYQHFNQISAFVSGGGEAEVFEHKFNYAAFRYVIVKGLRQAPVKQDAEAMLIDSDLEIVGSFECSNDLLTRIHEVNKWTQRCLNLGGYYVDCPHRERMGYGDGQVAAEGFMTSFRADGFYRKWLSDWRGVQQADGRMKNTAPWGKGGGGPGWGGLLSALSWQHYLYYGDLRVLEENYEAIKRYVDYLEGVSEKNGDILTGKTGKFSFIGDWVAPRRGMDSKDQPSHEARQVFNNAYRINQMDLLVKMARVLGKSEDAEHYGKVIERIRPKIHRAFFDPDQQQYVYDEQAYYVMPLMTGIVPRELRPAMLKKLEENIIEKNEGHLDSGMLGTYFMMEYLREIGRSDLVFTMFNQKTYPSWGYMLEQGATTLWEQWNGYWSQVHSCFTSPCNWLYQGLAGIQADPQEPGFKNVVIKPEVVGDVTWVRAHHDSPYGRIRSHWRKEGDQFTLEVEIPANSTATVYVPSRDEKGVKVREMVAGSTDTATFVSMAEGRALYQVAAGRYEFASSM